MLIPRYESLSVTIFASRLVDGEKVEDITVRRIFGGRLTRERCAKLDRNSKPRRFVWEGLHAVGLGGLSNWIEKGTTHGIQEFAHFRFVNNRVSRSYIVRQKANQNDTRITNSRSISNHEKSQENFSALLLLCQREKSCSANE
jgi:hypothetical protein